MRWVPGAAGQSGGQGYGGRNSSGGQAQGGQTQWSGHDRGSQWSGNRGGDQQQWTNGRNDQRQGTDQRQWNNGRNDGRNDSRNAGDRRDWNGGRGGNSGQWRNYQRNVSAQHRYRWGDYRRPSGWYSHRWSYGEFLPSLFWGRDYWINNYWSLGLPQPPYGCEWVRYGNDALLIDDSTGEIVQVIYGIFY